jgi:hypothetical protein
MARASRHWLSNSFTLSNIKAMKLGGNSAFVSMRKIKDFMAMYDFT